MKAGERGRCSPHRPIQIPYTTSPSVVVRPWTTRPSPIHSTIPTAVPAIIYLELRRSFQVPKSTGEPGPAEHRTAAAMRLWVKAADVVLAYSSHRLATTR